MPQSEVQHPKVNECDRSNTYGKPADVNTLRQWKRPFAVAERIRDFVLKKHRPLEPPLRPDVPVQSHAADQLSIPRSPRFFQPAFATRREQLVSAESCVGLQFHVRRRDFNQYM